MVSYESNMYSLTYLPKVASFKKLSALSVSVDLSYYQFWIAAAQKCSSKALLGSSRTLKQRLSVSIDRTVCKQNSVYIGSTQNRHVPHGSCVTYQLFSWFIAFRFRSANKKHFTSAAFALSGKDYRYCLCLKGLPRASVKLMDATIALSTICFSFV